MRKLNIRNQEWRVTSKHLVLQLHQPFWGAWKQYGWDIKCEGIGVSFEAVAECAKLGLRIKVIMGKYGVYEISPEKAQENGEVFITRDMKKLYVIPRIKFTKLPGRKQKEVTPVAVPEITLPKQEELL